MASAEAKKKRISTTTLIVISMILGVIAGIIGGKSMGEIQFVGDIFFHLVQMGIVPFVMCTIITAVGALTPQALSGFGLKGIVIFAVSSFIAAGIAIGLSVVFQPGMGLGGTALVQEASYEASASAVTFQDTLVGFFGSNIIASMSAGSMVQCIVFAIALGLVISFWRTTHDNQCRVYDFITELATLLLNIIRGIMKVAPIGIFCYVASMVGSLGAEVLIPLVKYLLVMAAAVLIMFVLYFVVTSIYCKLNPFKLLKKMWPMSALALGTISSAITLPVAMEDTKNKIGCDEEVVDLLLPLGMPLNSNGAAIHLAVTALTIAQIYGIAFSGTELLYVWVIAFLLSLANAVSPGASLVSLTMIVPQLGLPLASIGIFAGLEYPTGAIRTILNVDGDVFAALLVAGPKGINREVFDRDDKQPAAIE